MGQGFVGHQEAGMGQEKTLILQPRPTLLPLGVELAKSRLIFNQIYITLFYSPQSKQNISSVSYYLLNITFS